MQFLVMPPTHCGAWARVSAFVCRSCASLASLEWSSRKQNGWVGQGELWGWGTRVHARQLSLEFCFLHHIDMVCT